MAKEAAEKMKLTSEDLASFDVIDGIIKEPKKQEYDEAFVKKVATEIRKRITEDLIQLEQMDSNEVKEQRYEMLHCREDRRR